MKRVVKSTKTVRLLTERLDLDAAQRHHDIMKDFILRDIFQQSFQSAPVGDGLYQYTFAIDEAHAEEYELRMTRR